MCGIAGYYGSKKIERYRIHNCLKTMKNRGPDARGYINFLKGDCPINFI